jgi:beta-lactamase regulating signal transducer with metallopeptidase domain
MTLTLNWIDSSWMKALGWTFVHSIWQIAFIGLLLFIVLKCIPSRSAHTRYTISTLALWTTLITALCTFIVMLPEEKNITQVSGNIVLMAATKSASIAAQLSAWLEVRIPMMLTIWLGGVAILMLRLLISMGWVNHLRNDSIPKAELQITLDHIIQRLKLSVKATTSESRHIQSPVTIGHLKPLVLFPIGIINQLTPYEVEAILTHELAHIVRRDYLSNLIQSFIETLFYYHPVTWWISRMVRTERENRADDLAVSWCGDHLGYAKALLTIQEMKIHAAPKLAVGFASGKGAMLARIQRILHLPYKNHNQMEKTVLLCLCSLCFLAFTLTSNAHDNQTGDKARSPIAITVINENTVDSIPSTGTYKIHKKTDSQDISIEVKDGDIQELKIDGKEIAPSDFNEYGQVIDELFGSMDTPPSMEGFPVPEAPMIYAMPAMPAMPPLPPMEMYSFTMPPMAPMPNMREIEIESLRNLDQLRSLNDDSHFKIFYDSDNPEIHIITDSMINGKKQIVIINGKDSTVICTPGFGWSGDAPGAIAIDGRMMNEKEMQKWGEEMQRHAEVWGKEWKVQAEEWEKQAKQNEDQWKSEQDHWRSEEDRYRAEQERWNNQNFNYNNQLNDEALAREAERQIAEDYSGNQIYFTPSRRMSMSDEMVQDGLVEPGQEVEVQLTPDKLKINGHKVSDELHEKYLRMYEHQQGIELSGNSRVEFTTKSKQRM